MDIIHLAFLKLFEEWFLKIFFHVENVEQWKKLIQNKIWFVIPLPSLAALDWSLISMFQPRRPRLPHWAEENILIDLSLAGRCGQTQHIDTCSSASNMPQIQVRWRWKKKLFIRSCLHLTLTWMIFFHSRFFNPSRIAASRLENINSTANWTLDWSCDLRDNLQCDNEAVQCEAVSVTAGNDVAPPSILTRQYPSWKSCHYFNISLTNWSLKKKENS